MTPIVFTLVLTTCLPLSGIVGIQPADFESDWILMQSQGRANYVRTIDHGLGEVPLKVKVLVKPLAGPYANWLFEASTSQQADDDIPWLYCGIIYTYNISHVRLFAPLKSDKYDGGRAFCIDADSWTAEPTSPTRESQVDQDVLAKIMAWKSTSFPTPDLDTGWIAVAVRDPPNFIELGHNLGIEPDLVHLQTRCTPMYTEQMIYAEGVGSASNPTTRISRTVVMSGLVFGYSNTHIRVWAGNRGYPCILCIRDGYARLADGYRCMSGEFRVRAWKSLGEELEQFRFVIDGTIPDMSELKVNIRHWNPLTNYITVQAKALDGPNANFLFSGIGQGHRNVYPGTTYGGLLFGYSAGAIRIFVPANESGTIISIPENWGTAEYVQTSNRVEIIAKIWHRSSPTLCSANQLTSGRFSPAGAVLCPDNGLRCVTACLSRPSCVGVIRCPQSDDCQLMDINIVNNRLVSGSLGTAGEALLEHLLCVPRQ